MTRDELERCARFLEQGLEIDRATQRRLVLHALQLAGGQREHGAGCAFHRGETCDASCAPAPPKVAAVTDDSCCNAIDCPDCK